MDGWWEWGRVWLETIGGLEGVDRATGPLVEAWTALESDASLQIALGFAVAALILAALLLRTRHRDRSGDAERLTLAETERAGEPSFDPKPVLDGFKVSLRAVRERAPTTEERAAADWALERLEDLEAADGQLSKAIVDLGMARGRAPQAGTPIELALDAWGNGRVQAAVVLFQGALENEGEGRGLMPPATAARHLGALTSLVETRHAIAYYRRATEMAPADADAWGQLGCLLYACGDRAGAGEACRRVMLLGRARMQGGLMAVAAGTLGSLRLAEGDLDAAEAQFRIAIGFAGASRHAVPLAARFYGDLAHIADQRGAPDAATGYHRKALDVAGPLAERDGIAGAYAGLAGVAAAQGRHRQADRYRAEAASLHGVKDSPRSPRLTDAYPTAVAEESGGP